MSLGFFITAHNEIKATTQLLINIRKYHSENPIYLVSDGGFDFQETINDLNIRNVVFKLELDTLSDTFKVTDQNFTSAESQKVIKNSIYSFIERICSAIKLLNVHHMMVLDPDTKLRKNIEFLINEDKLLGSLVNSHLPVEFNAKLKYFGGLEIHRYGANPAIFSTEKFMAGLNLINKIGDIFFDEISKTFYGVYAYDLLVPIILSMAGETETFNPEIVECKRNRLWWLTRKAIVHQYRRYY